MEINSLIKDENKIFYFMLVEPWDITLYDLLFFCQVKGFWKRFIKAITISYNLT